jgi:tripartite-type tricarboxylate transporter receptor subunit TctC
LRSNTARGDSGVRSAKHRHFASGAAIACVLGLLFSGAAAAQNYPTKPIRFIVAFAPGGSSDVLARLVAGAMSQGLGTSIVVENRPGAGGNIGAEAAARAVPDGYSLLYGTSGTVSVGQSLYTRLAYDPLKDLAPVGMLHRLATVLIVHPSVEASNLSQLIDLARRNPGRLTYASAGSGSTSHLAAELLKMAADVDIVHVPYKGGGAAMPDLLAGRVSMMMETIPNALPSVRIGKLRAFGVSSATRSAAAPDLPTLAESGLNGFDVSPWAALFAPSGVPHAVVERLNRETLRIARDSSYTEQLKSNGVDAITASPEALGSYLRADILKWAEVVKRSGARLD